MRSTRRTTLSALAALAGLTSLALSGCVIPSPNPSNNARLTAVAATGVANAWAVGSYHDAAGDHDLAEHWDGHSWRLWALPAPLGIGLTSVAAVNASDVWAVGYARTLHFNGRSWYAVPTPAGVHVTAVAGGPDGSVRGLGHYSGQSTTLLLSMTAGGWRIVSAMPAPATHRACDGAGARAAALAVTSPSDVWVVGSTDGPTQTNPTSTCMLAEHWNGKTWQITPTPQLGKDQEYLSAVSARAAGDVWAVGTRSYEYAPTSHWYYSSVVLHFAGGRWLPVKSVDTFESGQLNAVDATGTGVWAVGTSSVNNGLIEEMLIKKLVVGAMVDQPVQKLPVDSGTELVGVSVRGNVVTSVGNYAPNTQGTVATLTDRRNAS